MSRTLRLTLAAAALAATAPVAPAFSDPDPPCRLHWQEGWIQSSPDFPVYVSVGRPYWVC